MLSRGLGTWQVLKKIFGLGDRDGRRPFRTEVFFVLVEFFRVCVYSTYFLKVEKK